MRILYLDLDTLRPDHLGCYGYNRNTSPNIDSVAEAGTMFTNYYCSDAPCLPSRTSLMTGMFGIRSGVVGHGGTAADLRLEGVTREFRSRLHTESLAGFLRSCGLKTVSISPFAERHSSWSFYAGFSEMHNTGKNGMESAEEITPTVIDWIKKNGQSDNWFLHVNYWDAHTPYRTPEEFENPFVNEPFQEWITEELLEKHRSMPGPHGPREIAMYDNKKDPKYPKHLYEIKDMKDLKDFVDGYDCGIKYMDSHIGLLLNELKAQCVYDDMMIIISSDHGENMGELGLYGEHATADYATGRIPMIIKQPGSTSSHVNAGLHYNLDLPSTLAELLGRSAPLNWDGISYAGCLKSDKSGGRESLVIGQCAHGCQRAVRFGSWIYIRTYHDHYHLFPKEMVFNVDSDPHQTNNLADVYPEICRHAAHILLDWHDDMMMKSSSDTDPLWTVMREGGPYHSRGKLNKYCSYLRETERASYIPDIRKKHPNEYVD
ncbi:MAG: sulfatase [Fibrobacteres bacterium]|nr:sulfatase [Fibrobacterota bacterium]